MKIIIEFDTEVDGPNRHKDAINGSLYKDMLFDISQQIFRPHRKHGYSNERLENIVQRNDEALEVIGILEEMFYKILEENNIDIFEE